jgi:tRNA(Ile)-lysidine synthetase-like protein
VLAVERLMKKGGSGYLDMGGAWRCHKENDRVWLERVGGLASESGGVDVASGRARAGALKDRAAVSLRIPGQAEWQGVMVCAEYVDFASADTAITTAKAADFAREAYLDAAALSPVLTVRGPQPGDRVRPLGASGSRKLQDIFVDRKVPARLRPQVPLVFSAERILWVGGMVTAEEGRITGETRRIVRLSLQRVGGDRQ